MKDSPVLKLQDVPKTYRRICEVIGLENGLKLSEEFGGDKIYIPQTKRVSAKLVHCKIQSEFTGANFDELAQKYGYTETWIREIVGQKSPGQAGQNAISLKYLPPSYRRVGQVIGIEAALKLCTAMGGKRIFVARLARALSRKRKREAIKSEFNGHNVAKLAYRYGYSKTWIREILKQDQQRG